MNSSKSIPYSFNAADVPYAAILPLFKRIILSALSMYYN
jgi:hypothetical protein